jgi:hypothetical protein
MMQSLRYCGHMFTKLYHSATVIGMVALALQHRVSAHIQTLRTAADALARHAMIWG